MSGVAVQEPSITEAVTKWIPSTQARTLTVSIRFTARTSFTQTVPTVADGGGAVVAGGVAATVVATVGPGIGARATVAVGASDWVAATEDAGVDRVPVVAAGGTPVVVDGQDVGHLLLGEPVGVHEHDTHALRLAQRFEQRHQPGLDVGHPVDRTRLEQRRARPTQSARRRLADPVQVPGRVRHGEHALAVLPQVGHRLGAGIDAHRRSVGRRQCPPQARLVLTTEGLERVHHERRAVSGPGS